MQKHRLELCARPRGKVLRRSIFPSGGLSCCPSAGMSSRPIRSLIPSTGQPALNDSPSSTLSWSPSLSLIVESGKAPCEALSSYQKESAAPTASPSAGPSCFRVLAFSSSSSLSGQAEWVAELYFLSSSLSDSPTSTLSSSPSLSPIVKSEKTPCDALSSYLSESAAPTASRLLVVVAQ
jgi:hypothetical protein